MRRTDCFASLTGSSSDRNDGPSYAPKRARSESRSAGASSSAGPHLKSHVFAPRSDSGCASDARWAVVVAPREPLAGEGSLPATTSSQASPSHRARGSCPPAAHVEPSAAPTTSPYQPASSSLAIVLARPFRQTLLDVQPASHWIKRDPPPRQGGLRGRPRAARDAVGTAACLAASATDLWPTSTATRPA
jgi:hypothetical protein